MIKKLFLITGLIISGSLWAETPIDKDLAFLFEEEPQEEGYVRFQYQPPKGSDARKINFVVCGGDPEAKSNKHQRVLFIACVNNYLKMGYALHGDLVVSDGVLYQALITRK